MAKIYQRVASSDKLLILGTRESVSEPFQAPGATDLRVGFFLSITDVTNDDLPNGAFAEDIVGASQAANYYYIGIKDTGPDFPMTGASTFMGFSNNLGFFREDHSVLSSSDIGIGTSNAWFWRPNNSLSANAAFLVSSGAGGETSDDGVQIHFPQDIVNAGGYSVMLGFRVIINKAPSNSFLIPHMNTHSSDMLYTNTPTSSLLLQKLDPWPVTVQTKGPLSGPSPASFALFAYWPFRLSRLRISAFGILKSGP